MKNITPAQKHKMLKILITGCLVLVITMICFVFPLRPKRSVSEKRPLAEFPTFTVKSFADGTYFSDISLWFSDTVPFRDGLLNINSKIQNFLGTDGAIKGFNEGAQGDEIPDPVIPSEDEFITSSEEETLPPAEPVFPEDDHEAQHVEHLGSILICDNAGYEYYNFVEQTAKNYALSLNKAYTNLGNTANIYAAVVPTSTDITLNQKVRSELSVSDQSKAIDFIYGSLNPGIKQVKSFDNIMSHRDEYVYFRTDHHWTALGAYYTYEIFCQQKGITPIPLSSFETLVFPGFLGSFYNDSGKDPALGGTPDEVTAYKPPCEYQMMVTDRNGSTTEWPLLYDESDAPAGNKYGTFICGDNPLSVIENLSMEDGESCLLVKESFGNAFAPFLVAHYKYVYVMDYRYYNGTITSLVNEKGIDDVIFLNNISMTRASSLVKQLYDHIG